MIRRTAAFLLVLLLAAPARAGDFDFDLTPTRPPSAEEKAAQAEKAARLDRAVKTRRAVLRAHQGFGFATLALMAVTLVLGQLNYQDKFSRDGEYTRVYQEPHLALAVGSAALFATTGILALSAPNPYPKPIKADAALAHKLLMACATAGMVTQLVLGPIAATKGGQLGERDFATAHLAVGYSTFALMAAGVLSYVF